MSGIDAQIGYGEEVTYGTRVAPTRFLEFNSEGIDLDDQRIESAGLRAGAEFLRSDRWVANRKGASGPVEHEVHNKGFGLLFDHAIGDAVITTPGGGTLSRDLTFAPTSLAGKSLTVQVGRPDVGDVVNPFDYVGCKVAEWALSNSVDGLLMYRHTLDAQDELVDQGLAVASYPASTQLLSFVGGSLTIGAVQYDVDDLTITGSNGLKTDRHKIRASSLKDEPLRNARRTVGVEVSSEFFDMAAYNRYRDESIAELVALWEGPLIEGILNFHVQVTMAACRTDGETPNVEGEDLLGQPLTFKALDNGTDPVIELVYRTTDTAI